MHKIENRYTDPTWDYNSIWETLGEMQNSLAKMMELLSSEEADAGNEKVDRRLLEILARVEGDCFLAEKALKSEDEMEIPVAFVMEQQLEAISHSSTETVLTLKSMSLQLAAINDAMNRINLTFNSHSS